MDSPYGCSAACLRGIYFRNEIIIGIHGGPAGYINTISYAGGRISKCNPLNFIIIDSNIAT